MNDRPRSAMSTTADSGRPGPQPDGVGPGLTELLEGAAESTGWPADDMLQAFLRSVREHMRMEVGFLSEFRGGQRVFRLVDAAEGHELVRAGNSDPLESGYCQRVVDGRLPELIHNAQELPEALELPVTRELGIGAHVSVPIKLPDGSVYGTFCCFSRQPDYSLTERDLEFLRTFADLTGRFVHQSAERAAEEEKRATLVAQHDRVSGLPTEEWFVDKLNTSIQHAESNEQRVHVIVSQIPLSDIRRSLGQEAINEIARTIARRMRALAGDDHLMARLASESWAFGLPPGVAIEETSRLAAELGEVLQEAMEVGREQIHLSAYLGISTYPDDAANGEGLLQAAFSAVGNAAAPGKPCFYSRDEQARALGSLRLEARLRRALEHNELEAWFQPQFRVNDRKIIGAEALVRWRAPSGEMVSPGAFLPAAERAGLIGHIDAQVMQSACQTLARWRSVRPEGQRISVNVTPADIRADDFSTWIDHLFERYGLPPGALEIELTETTLLEIDDDILSRLMELRTGRLKIRVAIDDFGTGYSSLSYLHKLPADILKIDKSFTARVPGDPGGESIIRALVGLAKEFDLELVAEGIEHQSQLDYLHTLGVQTGQGYLVGRPMPEAEFLHFCHQ